MHHDHQIQIAEAARERDGARMKLMQAADEMLRAVASANAAWRVGRRRSRARRRASPPRFKAA
jgi:hypothetical protein